MRPPEKGYDRELLAGLFILLGIFVIGLFSMKITDSPVFRPGTEYTVFLNDATGIYKKSKVRIAGINVGIVKSIELDKARAKLKILIDKGYKIDMGAYIETRSQGILGDKFLEIVVPRDQADRERMEKDGSQIKDGTEDPDIKPAAQPATNTSSWFPKLNIFPLAAADELHQPGDTIPAKQGSASADDVMKKLGDIGSDVKILAKDLREIIQKNKGNIDESLKAIRRSADNLDLVLGDLSEKNTRADMKQAIRGMREAVDNIKLITGRVNNGEGTLGKLINDPQVADQLVRALNSINEFLEKARRTEVTVDLNTNFITGTSKSKSYFNLQIMPRSSYGYYVGAVQDPGGSISKSERTIQVDNNPPSVIRETNVNKSGFRFNAQFIRKVFRTRLRLGVFESTGGVGLDQEIWKDRLYITGEAFDFGRDNDNAHVRVLAKLIFLDSLYVQGGIEELASKYKENRNKSLFVGLGIRFNDDDIKNFLVLLGP